MMQIICLSENYQSVLDKIHKNVKIKKIQKNEVSVFSQTIYTLLALLLGIFLLPRLPIHFPGAFTIPMIILAFPVIWSTKKLQKFSAVTIILLQITGISLAFYFGEVDFSRDGAKYAMAVQCLAFMFYLYISVRVFLNGGKNE